MTRRHYIWMIVIVIVSFIINLPYIFGDIPAFNDLIEDEPVTLLIISQIAGLFYWPSILYYFKIKKWKSSFYSGIALFISSTFLSFIMVFTEQSFAPTFVILMVLITLLYLISFMLYCISFFLARTKNHKLIRAYAVINVLVLVFTMLTGFLSELKGFHLAGILSVTEAVILILHFVRERHIDSEAGLKDSDEILDTI
jgi:hypothetical protein